jgi:hypothetical protein
MMGTGRRSVIPSGPAILKSLIPYTVVTLSYFSTPSKLPRITTTIFEHVIGLTYSTTAALGLGGQQRAVRPVD